MENDINGKRILIESGGGIGDLIMFTPALRRMKEKFPQCYITFLTIDKTVDVINRIPYIDKVIAIKRGRFMGRYRVLPELIKQDYLIFTEWQPHLLLCAWLLHLPNRFSVGRDRKFLTKTLDKRIINTVSSTTDFAAQTNAKLISEVLGINLDKGMTECDVSLPNIHERNEVDNLLYKFGLRDKDFIVLSPFASSIERDWPLEEVKKLLNAIKEKYNIPVVIVGNTFNEELNNWCQYNLLCKTNIMQLIELIRRAKCLITPDSGPMHIAGALHTPCIALFSKDTPSRWAPKKFCWPIYLNYDCSPCDSKVFRNCPYGLKCMKNITAEMVMEKLSYII